MSGNIVTDKTDCCDRVFSDFQFQSIRIAQPPARKGVYVVRVSRMGRPLKEIIEQGTQIVQRLNWPLVGRKIMNRTGRLERVNLCPIVYLGSAGTQNTSKHTLKGRYKDFAGRHTAMYPLWLLLYFGWEIEYGWLIDESPAITEKNLKHRYKELHDGKLPALVHR